MPIHVGSCRFSSCFWDNLWDADLGSPGHTVTVDTTNTVRPHMRMRKYIVYRRRTPCFAGMCVCICIFNIYIIYIIIIIYIINNSINIYIYIYNYIYIWMYICTIYIYILHACMYMYTMCNALIAPTVRSPIPPKLGAAPSLHWQRGWSPCNY